MILQLHTLNVCWSLGIGISKFVCMQHKIILTTNLLFVFFFLFLSLFNQFVYNMLKCNDKSPLKVTTVWSDLLESLYIKYIQFTLMWHTKVWVKLWAAGVWEAAFLSKLSLIFLVSGLIH